MTQSELQLSRVVVSVERHLQTEVELLSRLESLNQTLADSLTESGSTGLSYEQSKQLSAESDLLMANSKEIRKRRSKVLEMIRQSSDSKQGQLSIRQFIETLSDPTKQRLESIRSALLDRLTDVHASMLGNQAVMFYTYDFNRKLVSGLLGTENDDERYRVDGQSSGIKPGNLIQKAC